MKALVETEMSSTYATSIESVHMAFLVDGSVVECRCAKAEQLKLMRSKKEIWVDLGVPVSAWRDRNSGDIRNYLCECVEGALTLIVARLKKDKLCEGCERLWDDWAAAKAEYLTQTR